MIGDADPSFLSNYVPERFPGIKNEFIKTRPSYQPRCHHSVDTTPSHFAYSPLTVCGLLRDSSASVLSFWTVKLRPSFSSAMLLLASCSFLSIDAMCLTKSDWVLSTVCFSWDSFSLRSAMSLSFPKRVCLRKPISFSLAVKTQINITITHYRSLNNFKVWAIKLTGKTQKTELSITEREAGGRGGWQHLVKWFPSSRALFFSCMRDHIKLTVNLCFKVDDLLC